MSHSTKRHHLPRSERQHKPDVLTHREKKDHERLMYGHSMKAHEGKFTQEREAVLNSKRQEKMIEKVKSEEAASRFPGKKG